MTFNPSDLNYSFDNFIGIYENIFTKKECEDAINLFEKFHKNKFTHEKKIDGLIMKDTSLSIIASIVELEWADDFILPFHDRFYDYIYPIYNLKYPTLQMLIRHKSKFIKIQKTKPQEGYHTWHCEHDAYVSSERRILSWILYLNTVDDGGETEFLYQSLRIKPKQGTFVMFPAGFTHTHRGNPPLKDNKYIATGWIEFLNTTEMQGISKFPDLKNNSSNKLYQYL
jgi:hypothetical protein